MSHPRTLHHFVGHKDPNNNEVNFQTLVSVLESKCIRVNHKDGSGYGYSGIKFSLHTDTEHSLENETLMQPRITCYADIPTDDLGIHVSKYGMFGISFRQDYLIREGARPVMYIPMHKHDWNGITGRQLLRDLDCIAKGYHMLNKHEGPHRRSVGKMSEDIEHASQSLWGAFGKDFLAFLKPFDADLPDDDPKYYIMEREWRKFGNQPFEERDIVRIFIANTFVDRFVEQFPQLSDKIHIIPTKNESQRPN